MNTQIILLTGPIKTTIIWYDATPIHKQATEVSPKIIQTGHRVINTLTKYWRDQRCWMNLRGSYMALFVRAGGSHSLTRSSQQYLKRKQYWWKSSKNMAFCIKAWLEIIIQNISSYIWARIWKRNYCSKHKLIYLSKNLESRKIDGWHKVLWRPSLIYNNYIK